MNPSLRILIVEDSASDVDLLQRTLRRALSQIFVSRRLEAS